jgi:acyl-CoA synthetase (AMP-forming)/AMP-acid ligase II
MTGDAKLVIKIGTCARALARSFPSLPILVGREGSIEATYSELVYLSDLLAQLTGGFDGPLPTVAIVTDRFDLIISGLLNYGPAWRGISFHSSNGHLPALVDQVISLRPDWIIADHRGFAEKVAKDVGTDVPLHAYGNAYVISAGASRKTSGRCVFGQDDGQDEYCLVYSSGTTGRPRGILHSHETLFAGYAGLRKLRFELLGQPKGPPFSQERVVGVELSRLMGPGSNGGVPMTYLTGMPSASIGGVSLAMQALLGGETLVSKPEYDPREQCEVANRAKASNLSLPPIAARGLLGLVEGGVSLGNSLMVIGIGGSLAERQLLLRLEESSGCRVMTGYGTTESGGVALTPRFDDEFDVRTDSIGRAVPGMDARISDGELCLRSNAIAQFALVAPGRVVPLLDSEGWYRTGDHVEWYQGDNIRFLERKDGIVVRGSRKIDPRRVEEILLRHPQVRGANVWGERSALSGEGVVVADLIVDEVVGRYELRKWCADHGGTGLIPQRIRLTRASGHPAEAELDGFDS